MYILYAALTVLLFHSLLLYKINKNILPKITIKIISVSLNLLVIYVV